MDKKYNEIPINEYVFEFRYKANPKVLDYRGTWAELLTKYMDLKHFAIIENRVDVYNQDQSMKVFVSYVNAGLIIRGNAGYQYFADKCEKFIRFIFEEKGFGNPVHINRIGVRFRCAYPYGGDFTELLDKITERQFSLSPGMLDIFKAEIVDIGSPVNFRTKIGNLHTMTGPMKEDQLHEFFPNNNELLQNGGESFIEKTKFPKVAYYIDLDYWKMPDKDMANIELIKEVRDFSQSISDITERMINLVF